MICRRIMLLTETRSMLCDKFFQLLYFLAEQKAIISSDGTLTCVKDIKLWLRQKLEDMFLYSCLNIIIPCQN